MQHDVTNRVAWVTGAGGGIGRAAATALDHSGWRVWATDVAPQTSGDLDHSESAGWREEALDVTDAAAVEAFVRRVVEREGRLDAVVASAAVFPRRSLAATSAADVARVLAVNVNGVVATVLAARSAMDAGGSIVVMTSGASARGVARLPMQRGFADYGASKAAVERWVLGICDDLAADGIAIHLLCPGRVVATPGVARVLDERDVAEAVGPDYVAPAIVRLCNRRDVATTGGRYVVDDVIDR